MPNPDLILKPGFKAVVRFEASGKSQMKLKSIPAKLGYIVGAQWTRDLAWTAFYHTFGQEKPGCARANCPGPYFLVIW